MPTIVRYTPPDSLTPEELTAVRSAVDALIERARPAEIRVLWYLAEHVDLLRAVDAVIDALSKGHQ